MLMKTKFSIEQEVLLGNCYGMPPCLLFAENNRYYIKEGDQTVGVIEEKCETMCRIIMPATTRSSVFSIKFNGLEYTAEKKYRLASHACCTWLCCQRPDIIVRQGDRVVGSVVLPCLQAQCAKMCLDLYKGETREPADVLCRIQKCMLNCHCLYGRTYGFCCDCARYMVFDVTGGSGYLDKQHFGVINECLTSADKYNFEFPSSKPDDMATYLSAIVFADMLWYEGNYCGMSSKI
jgi:hypothetical protein